MKIALVTDIERRTALPVIRSLGRAGITVIGLSTDSWPIGRFSKYCREFIRSAHPVHEPDAFGGQLADACRRFRPDVLVPIEESTVAFLARHETHWSAFTRSLLPPAEAIRILGDKWETIRLAQSLGIPVPDSHCPDDADALSALAKSWNGPFVVKPRNSQGSVGIRYGLERHQLADAYAAVAARWSRPVVQQRIEQTGEAVGVSVLFDSNREVVATFCHRRLREYPLTGGPSTLSESCHNPALVEQAIALLQAVQMTGIAMVEFKWSPAAGQYVLMEVNPRFWGSLALPISAGVNFPCLYFDAALGAPAARRPDYEDGRLCRWLWPGDLLHFLKSPQRFRLDPGFFEFRRPCMTYSILSADDPWPAVAVVSLAWKKTLAREPR